mmetsp:Transcript_95529/g.218760  ORF Transcript_95529/g.218760 Transcript_95529/m.218760 type:complete len:196 (+) Transcript_95529:377-964(+)
MRHWSRTSSRSGLCCLRRFRLMSLVLQGVLGLHRFRPRRWHQRQFLLRGGAALNGVSTEGKTLKVELKKGDEVNAVAPPAGVERMSHEKLPSVTGVRKPAAGNWAPNMMMMPGQIPSGLTSLSSASGVGGLAALGLGNLGLGGLGMQQLANLRLGGTMPALTGLPSVPALTGMGTVPALTGASTGAATTQPGLLG